jgi:hypothetical protein
MRRTLRVAVLLGVPVLLAGRADAKPAAPARWKPLRSASASATSFLQNDWNRFQENYHPNYVLDENPATAWVEGAEGQGEGESITLPLSALSSARALRLRIWNGFQKSRALAARNSAPRRVTLAVLDGAGVEVATEEAELTRAWGPQAVVIDVPPARSVAAVRLTVRSVYPGTRYKDTCISDVLVDVDSDVPYNAAAEEGKRAALHGWVDGRKAVAAYFAARPPEFPFAFTSYVGKAAPFDPGELDRRFAEREALAAKLGAARYRPVIKKPLPIGPDGLSDRELHLDDFLQLFNVEGVSLFETGDPIAMHRKFDANQQELWITSARVARTGGSKAAPIAALDLGVRHVFTERTTSTSKRQLLLAYDERGRLTRVYRETEETSNDPADDYAFVQRRETFDFTYDGAGKVERVDYLERGRYSESGTSKKRLRDSPGQHVIYAGVADRQGGE